MSIHLLDRELAGFDDLSLKTYRLKFEERTDPESWQIGELTGLGGPGGSILFSELWHDLVHPADREELAGVYQEILDNRSTKWRVRFRWFAENLTILHIGFFDAEKQLVEGVLLDVTEDREFRADLVQKEKIAALGLMAGGIAHDINNLLCAILSFSKFAEDDLPPDSQSRQDIAEVIKAAERAACLTKQLLTFSRQRQSPVESVDLNERVTQLGTILSRLLGEAISLKIKPSPSPAVVMGDPVQFDQVILNLAVNARDAMLPQGGQLTISLEPREENGEMIVLKVQDSGKGMEPETLERIFEPFFTTKEQGRGTGLGLATCFSIIEQTRGQIRVQSSPGKGTIFQIEWPQVKPVVKSLKRSAPMPIESGDCGVLVVEDDPAVRRVCDRILSQAGYKVHTAENGKEALKILREHNQSVQVVLTDMVMPKLGGIELADSIDRDYPHISVILSSGYPEQGAQLEQAEKTTLWKPFQREELLAAVSKVSRRRSKSSELEAV